MHTITFDDPALRFMGRIDDDNPKAPIWVFPYTQVSFRCTGSHIRVKLRNHWNYGDIFLGAIIDGLEVKVPVPIDATTITLAEHLPDIEHEVTIFKRQDGGMCHLEMLGIELDDGATILPPADARPPRRMEVYGDSVSCGERNEAIRYVGQADPEVDLSGYSDSWHSYAAIAARMPRRGTARHIAGRRSPARRHRLVQCTALSGHGKHVGPHCIQSGAG